MCDCMCLCCVYLMYYVLAVPDVPAGLDVPDVLDVPDANMQCCD